MLTAIKKRLLSGKRDVDMTEGNIPGHIIKFAIPLLMGNFLQQLYNMVDTWVVGNYVGAEAFSAVGTVGPIINMLISLFWGFSAGAGVVVSQYYGAKKYDKVSDTVHTTLLITVIFGIIATGIGIAIVPLMLDLMNTPPEVLDEATLYLRIYFAGLLGLVLYNVGSGILRAVGDSRRPFYFLAISAVTNTVLDLLFVIKFNMGVAGVALATIIAQGFSAALIIITLTRTSNCIKIYFRRFKVHKQELFKIIKVGLPVALQMVVTSFSNVFVQAYINYFGAGAMGGWTAYSKIDQLVLLPMQSIALASTTFVGQNLGMGDVKRAKKGVNVSLLLATSTTVIIMIPILVFAPELVSFFNNESEIVAFGAVFLRWMTPFYVLCCINQIYAGALRGSGNATAPMIIMLCSFVGFRQLYLFITANFISNTPIPIAMSYPAGWLVCSTAMFIYYKMAKLEKGRIVK